MTTATTLDRVREALHGITSADEDGIKPEHRLNAGDLFLDSMDRLELAMALEDRFSFDISDEDCANWATVAEICAYLDGRQKESR